MILPETFPGVMPSVTHNIDGYYNCMPLKFESLSSSRGVKKTWNDYKHVYMAKMNFLQVKDGFYQFIIIQAYITFRGDPGDQEIYVGLC